MHEVHIDIETFSPMDLNKAGVYRYTEDPRFKILLVGVSEDGSPVRVYDLAQGQKLPKRIVDALLDEGVLKFAHNASFERVCLSRFLWDQGLLPRGTFLDPMSWHCTMVWSAYAGLPLSLKAVGEALELSKGKMDEGKGLIRLFCQPSKTTSSNDGKDRILPSDAPEKWELFKSYNKRDVEVEMEIARKLATVPVPEQVWMEYQDSERINDRGIMIDRTLVENAILLDTQSQKELTEALRAITDLENPRSVSQMKEWLQENGLTMDTLGKKEVAGVLRTAPEPLRTVLLLRREIAKSSVKKYTAMQAAACRDGRLRGMFMFYGASRSGRFSGRIVQLQNLYRNSLPDLEECRSLVKAGDYDALETMYDSVPTCLAECTRTAFIPSPGNWFIVCDYSAIEARVLAWMAEEGWRVQAFTEGQDIYCASASQMFGVPVVKHGENGHLRQKGKIAELALGYGGSVGALRSMGALEMGLQEDELLPLVTAWRTANPHIVQFWWKVDRAVKATIKTHEPQQVGPLRFHAKEGRLFVRLPSGRDLVYVRPRVGENRFGGESITYLGIDAKHHWAEVESYGPKFVENCVAIGSLVITDQGPVPIEKVTRQMKVWDGQEYVDHQGVVAKGVQPTIEVDGLRVTPDHHILTKTGWVEARQAKGKQWFDFYPFGERHLISVNYAPKALPVYDLLNAGPRHRFALWNGNQQCVVSNCTQAVSRDILCHAIHNLRDYGIVAHVHDEVICDVPQTIPVKEVEEIMSRVPDWAEGLALRADGYSCFAYQKDA